MRRKSAEPARTPGNRCARAPVEFLLIHYVSVFSGVCGPLGTKFANVLVKNSGIVPLKKVLAAIGKVNDADVGQDQIGGRSREGFVAPPPLSKGFPLIKVRPGGIFAGVFFVRFTRQKRILLNKKIY